VRLFPFQLGFLWRFPQIGGISSQRMGSEWLIVGMFRGIAGDREQRASRLDIGMTLVILRA